MGHPDRDWRTFYETQIELIDRVVGFVCRRNGLRADEADEFRSEVHLRLIDGEYSILRQFDERSSLRTYLSVVIQRFILDFRTERWGKWRPSEAARRRGDEAVLLETLVIRDGIEFSEALEILRTNHGSRTSRDELYATLVTFPERWGRASQREANLDEVAEPLAASARNPLDDDTAPEITTALRNELATMSSEERTILEMMYLEGRKISVVSRTLGIAQKPLYRTVRELQSRLRTTLERNGISWSTAQPLLEDPRGTFDLEDVFHSRPSNHPNGAAHRRGGS